MSTTYRVCCEWNPEGAWTVTVPGLPGAVTQCRRLDQVEPDIREAIELITGEAAFAVELAEVVGLDVIAEAMEVRSLREEAERCTAAVERRTRETAARLRAAGFTYRDAGVMLGVSHQRVQQLAR